MDDGGLAAISSRSPLTTSSRLAGTLPCGLAVSCVEDECLTRLMCLTLRLHCGYLVHLNVQIHSSMDMGMGMGMDMDPTTQLPLCGGSALSQV